MQYKYPYKCFQKLPTYSKVNKLMCNVSNYVFGKQIDRNETTDESFPDFWKASIYLYFMLCQQKLNTNINVQNNYVE